MSSAIPRRHASHEFVSRVEPCNDCEQQLKQVLAKIYESRSTLYLLAQMWVIESFKLRLLGGCQNQRVGGLNFDVIA